MTQFSALPVPIGLSPDGTELVGSLLESCPTGASADFATRLCKLDDPVEAVLIAKWALSRLRINHRRVQMAAYGAWRAHSEVPTVGRRRAFLEAIERGNGLRETFEHDLREIADPLERADILTATLDQTNSWAAHLRDLRDEAIQEALDSGVVPRRIARLLEISKTHVINARRRILDESGSAGIRVLTYELGAAAAVLYHLLPYPG